MRIVLVKDCALGRAGQVISVSVHQAQVLIRTGQAKAYSFKDEVRTK